MLGSSTVALKLDFGRATKISCVTAGLTMFATHAWYQLTDRLAPPKDAGLGAVAAKVISEEVLFTPLYNSMYLIGVPVILGHGVDAGLANWRMRFKVGDRAPERSNVTCTAVRYITTCAFRSRTLTSLFLSPRRRRRPNAAGRHVCERVLVAAAE